MPVAIPPRTKDFPVDLIRKLEEADINKDGSYTRDELKTALKNLGAIFPGWRVYRCFLKADSDGDGHICGKEIDTLVDYLISHGYGNVKP